MFFLYLVLYVTTSAVAADMDMVGNNGTAMWPNGTYGLLKAASGCPGGGVPWMEGARTFDTEDSDAHNYFSYNVYSMLAGSFDANDITTEFCMKITTADDDVAPDWPNGNYCIMKFDHCPDGFKEGSITWDGADFSNHNSASGVLPSGSFNTNTRIDFCCRSDGRPEIAVSLPTSKPFVLFRYGYLCQKVAGMSLAEIFVRWDDEDTFNSDDATGAHPFDDGGSKDHKLHMCHYSRGSSVVG